MIILKSACWFEIGDVNLDLLYLSLHQFSVNQLLPSPRFLSQLLEDLESKDEMNSLCEYRYGLPDWAMYGGLASDGKFWSNVLITNILCLAPYVLCSWHIYNVFLSHLKCAIRTFIVCSLYCALAQFKFVFHILPKHISTIYWEQFCVDLKRWSWLCKIVLYDDKSTGCS